MYDIREELMHKMVRELRDQQSHFEIMSDEECYGTSSLILRSCLMRNSIIPTMGSDAGKETRHVRVWCICIALYQVTPKICWKKKKKRKI